MAVEAAGRLVAAAHARHGRLEARIVEGLEQVVDRAHLERLERVVVVGGDEHDQRQRLRVERARQCHAGHRVHLDVEEQQLRRLAPDRLEGRARVAVLPDHVEVGLALAALAHACGVPPARRRR